MDPTRLVLYEDNAGLRASLGAFLAGAPGLLLVGEFASCAQAGADAARLRPDVVLMDIDMPDCSGIEGLRRVKAAAPATLVVMLTVFEDNDRVFDAICAGADGYLLKKTPPARLLEAIAEVRAGGAPMTPVVARQVLRLFPRPGAARSPAAASEAPPLSARELEILGLLVEGYSYKMIAARCFISLDTVRSHIKKIYEKLHVRSSTEAVSKALREGLA
ncbi:response regulator [Hymenobacter caeli]|uniref:DNA-binding NarL/FixJ family response regulator n=1 Tax=Hymenobacter caeli TaxID=2735894 RepID=A0ABX2FMM0_9BACT|nr:response regulator transcription factor [Hymenobacter caeli]NRT18389.1 DNA-binding NarL/FixJ family response regulator [Hymenobacter caeli]